MPTFWGHPKFVAAPHSCTLTRCKNSWSLIVLYVTLECLKVLSASTKMTRNVYIYKKKGRYTTYKLIKKLFKFSKIWSWMILNQLLQITIYILISSKCIPKFSLLFIVFSFPNLWWEYALRKMREQKNWQQTMDESSKVHGFFLHLISGYMVEPDTHESLNPQNFCPNHTQKVLWIHNTNTLYHTTINMVEGPGSFYHASGVFHVSVKLSMDS